MYTILFFQYNIITTKTSGRIGLHVPTSCLVRPNV